MGASMEVTARQVDSITDIASSKSEINKEPQAGLFEAANQKLWKLLQKQISWS